MDNDKNKVGDTITDEARTKEKQKRSADEKALSEMEEKDEMADNPEKMDERDY